MANVKTAISLDESLFDQVEATTRELKISRSRFFAMAAQEFIERRRNRALLAAINAACDDELDEEDAEFIRRIKQYSGKVLDEWK